MMRPKFLLLATASLAFLFAEVNVHAETPKTAQIDKNGILILIKNSIIAIDQANKTGNYTVVRDLGAPEFQLNTAAKLSEIFLNIRKIDLSGIIVIEPHLTLMPQIESSGMMRVAGYFPSVPTQIYFEMLFAPINGEWRLFGISISQTSAAPRAPNIPDNPNAELRNGANNLRIDRVVKPTPIPSKTELPKSGK